MLGPQNKRTGKKRPRVENLHLDVRKYAILNINKQQFPLHNAFRKLVSCTYFRPHQNHPDFIDYFPKHLYNSQIERGLEAAQASEEISYSNKT